MPFYKRKLFWLVFLLSFTIIAARYLKIHIHDEGFGKSWYYGDAFSERNNESAAKFYLDHGFKPNCGLPVFFYDDNIPGNERIYTHYPPLSEWIAGVMANITGDYHDPIVSLFPLLLSLILFFLIFKILAEMTGNPEAGFLSATILVLANYFICWADDIHQHVYVEFCKWLFVYLWWKYLRSAEKKYLTLLPLCILYAAMCFLSFEPYVYIAVIIVGFSWVIERRIFRWEIILLAAVPLFMFWLRLNINANYLGGYDAMITDMKFALTTRLGSESGYSELGRAMTWQDYVFLLPKIRLQRLGHFYIFPTLILIYLGILALRDLKKNNKQLFGIAIVVYLAAFSWILLMPQHALIHIFTLRHIAIFMGLTIGFGLLAWRKQLQLHFSEKKYLYMGLHCIGIAYTVLYAGVNTFYYIYIKYGLMYPNLGTDSYVMWDHFLL